MPIVRTLVVLATYGDHGTIHRPREAAWFHEYFFNPVYGLKAYWLKQTDNRIVLDGQVINWRHYQFDLLNIMNRSAAGTAVFGEVRQSLGVDLSKFDLPVVVFGLPPQMQSDGGSGKIVMNPPREVRGVVGRTEVAFDFWAHEIGHGIGLEHSFGKDPIPVIGENPGGYGHPHCIMSAQTYGGYSGAGAFHPPDPRDGRPEYSGLGPSLNAATALFHGWVDAHVFSNSMPRNYRIRSRSHGGRNPNETPQALMIQVPSGDTYVVEYRERTGWDRGQNRDYLIVTQGKGGLADYNYPNQFTGSFAARLGLPVDPTAVGQNWLEFWNFAIQLIEVDPVSQSILVRVYPGGAPQLNVTSTTTVTVQHSEIVETGEHQFQSGKVRCVDGTWAYEKREQTTVAVFEAHWQPAEGVAAQWTLWGQPVPANGTFKRWIQVRLPTPQLVIFTTEIEVALQCQVTPLVDGTRLTVTSSHENFVFTLEAQLTMAGPSAISNEEFWAEMAGIVYDYGEEFEERRMRCLVNLSNPIERFPTYEVQIELDAWRDIPWPKHREVELLLKILARFHEVGDLVEFERARSEIAMMAGRKEIGLTLVALADRLDTIEFVKRPLPGCTFTLAKPIRTAY
jgi:hypothetical protein